MKPKNILDEMQEQKRLQIESRGFWIAFFGLFAIILIEVAMNGGRQDLRNIWGELALIVLLAVYSIPNYLRHGIWSTQLKPTLKSNLIISIVAALFVAIYNGVLSYTRYGKAAGSVATALISFGFTLALCMVPLSLCAWLYKRRNQKLENAPETELIEKSSQE